MGSYPFVLCLALPGDLDNVARLVREAAEWLGNRGIDQWQEPWPDRAGQRERILNDLFKGKTWLLRDGKAVAGTITVDTDEPLDVDEHPIWPPDKSQRPALYVRRVIVSRRYTRRGLGAALLDWAADVAKRDHGAELIRIDVRTTNEKLHAYYEAQSFIRCPDPQGLGDYPSQALFERSADAPGSDFTRFFITEEGQGARKLPHQGRRQPQDNPEATCWRHARAKTCPILPGCPLPDLASQFRTVCHGATFLLDGI